MIDRLLLESRQLDGPRQVGVTVRPVRTAYLVNPSEPSIAVAAIDAACLEWGGAHNFLIPCDAGDTPSKQWLQILDKLDPDVILDLVGASEEFKQRNENKDRAVRRWEKPTDTIEVAGASIYGPLRLWKGAAQQVPMRVPNLEPLAGHSLALPLAFRFGHLDGRPLGPTSPSREAPQSARHADFLDVCRFDPHRADMAELLNALLEVPVSPSRLCLDPPSGLSACYTLIDLTTLGVPSQEPGYSHGWQPPPEYEQHDEAFFQRLVVVGAASSVPDLCLAWNLRAQRMDRSSFPLWLDPVWLDEKDVVPFLLRAAGYGRGGLSELSDGRGLHLVSASLPFADLESVASRLQDRLRVEGHPPDTLDRFFTDTFRTGRTREFVLNFRNGTVDVPTPDYSELGYFSYLDRIGASVSIEGWRQPSGSPRHFRRFGSPVRLARNDLALWFVAGAHPPGALLQVGTNNGWQIATGLASPAGYEVQLSDKGRLAVALLRLLDQPIGLALLASSKVYEILVDMAAIVPRQAVQGALRGVLGRDPDPHELVDIVAAFEKGQIGGGQFDRQHVGSDKLRQLLGVDPKRCDRVLRWLVDKQVLLRGYEVKCPSCGVRRWYPVERMSHVHRCDGCLAEMPLPLPVRSLDWRYRLNELVGQGRGSGSHPPYPGRASVRAVGEWSKIRRAGFPAWSLAQAVNRGSQGN